MHGVKEYLTILLRKGGNMKRYLVIISIISILLVIPFTMGCTKGCRKNLKHTKSKWVGLKRQITWYDYNRNIIRSWEGRFNVENLGGGIAFEGENNKETKIVGGLILVEEQ